MHPLRWFLIGSLALVVAAFVAGAPAPTATAATTNKDIASAGPLTHIYIGNELSCQIAHTGDTLLELFPPSVIPGDCGTFVVVDGVLYAPDFLSHGGTATGSLGTYTTFTPVSQSAVTGTGTAGDPLTVVTVADAGASGIRITETDRYVIGDESYRTDVVIQNTGNAGKDVLVYRAGDCYLGGSDVGYGVFDPITKAIGCTKTANNTPPDRIEVWSPITQPQHYYQSYYGSVWAAIGAKTNLPDTCACATSQDNGAALEWDRTITAGGSATISHLTTFSPLGSQPLVATKTADAATAAPSSADGYTITISNPNAADVTVTSIVDTLPAGFAYTPGSSSGLTTSDPSIAAQVLTWAGSFSISGGGSGTLHFGVTVAGAAGTYYNSAAGTADGFDIVPTGDTAPITVEGGEIATPTNTPPATNTPTATPAEECAPATATNTPVPTSTNTPLPTATDTALPEAFSPGTAPHTETSATPERTGTAPAVTRTVIVTLTPGSTLTPVITQTPQTTPSPPPSPTAESETATPSPTPTATASPTATATACITTTVTPGTTSTVTLRTHTPESESTRTRTSTPPANTSTVSAGTASPASTVLGIATGPEAAGGAAGTRALPNTGAGDGHATANWIVAIAALVMAAGSIAGAVALRQRRR